MAAPAAKKAKIDGEAAEKKEEKGEKKDENKTEEPEDEEPKELEVDAKADSRPKIKEKVTFPLQSTTMNVMPAFGNILTSLTDGAFQYLLAGARGNVGLTAGRYMFEVKVLAMGDPSAEAAGPRGKAPAPKNCLRIGFTTASSSLILCDCEEGSIYFDTEGFVMADKKKKPLGHQAKFGREQVVSVVLNLDTSSPNANTISLFKDGERVSEPQKLPESFKGKPLFPAVSYRNLTLQYNFDGPILAPLPFKCKLVQEAAVKDASVVAEIKMKDDKSEVLFPTGLPNEGTFLWLDDFLSKNPTFVEISDRALLKWLERSGVARPRGYGKKGLDSMDKPSMETGLPSVDDLSCQKLLLSVASLQPRQYVVMEVKAGLLKEDRQQLLTKFSNPSFKKVAVVVVGEPPADFKKISHNLTLADKQEVSDREFKVKLAADKKKKEEEKKKKEAEKKKKQAAKELKKKQKEAAKKKKEAEKKKKEAEKKKKEEEAKKKAEEAKKKAEEEGAEATEEAKDEEMPAAEKEEEKEEEEEVEEEEEEEEEEEKEEVEEVPETDPEPPKAELTEAEKKEWFYSSPVPDITVYFLNINFTKFSLPEKAEGFDEVRYMWAKDKQATEYLKKWVMERKLVTRVEDVVPGDWFNTQWKAWQKSLSGWHADQSKYKTAVAKKESDKVAKKNAKEAKKAAADKLNEQKTTLQKVVDENAALIEAAETEDAKKTPEVKKKLAEEKLAKVTEEQEKLKEKEKEEEEEEAEKEDDFNFDELDIFDIEDISHVGGTPAMPLFTNFLFEDWQMVSLRFEMNLLAHAFSRDVKDPDRKSIYMDHLPFYYQKYFKKAMNLKFFGVSTTKELADMIKDTVSVATNNTLIAHLPEEMETHNIYVMLAEEARRDRLRRIDMGDESAKLKITQATVGSNLTGLSQGSAVRTVIPAATTNVRPATPQAVTPGIVRPQVQPSWGKAPTPWRPTIAGTLRPAAASPYGAAWRPSPTPTYAPRPAWGPGQPWRPLSMK